MSSTDRLRIFVGDVHGCADELDTLLAKLRFDRAAHDLIFVGDLVNRGPASCRVLRAAIELEALSVIGNHDMHLLGRATGARPAKRRDTLDELLDAPDAGELLDWLRGRPPMLFWDDVILVHAGLHPAWTDPQTVAAQIVRAIDREADPFAHEDLRFATTVRHCDAEGTQPANLIDRRLTPGAPWMPWDHWYRGGRTVVCGHWAQRGLVVRQRLRALDTGCVWGGSLTAWIAEEDRLVAVPARRAYQAPR